MGIQKKRRGEQWGGKAAKAVKLNVKKKNKYRGDAFNANSSGHSQAKGKVVRMRKTV